MSNYHKAETEAVNDFLAAIHAGRISITAQDAFALCMSLHAATVELPEMNWMESNFENLADDWFTAIECCEGADHDT